MEVKRPIRTIIVDDEEPARAELSYLLKQFPDVDVVYSAASFAEASAAVDKFRPHLVFMDIQMPGTNGMQAVEQLLEAPLPPLVVFATAHEEFALKAFELNVVDYLLKPFSAKRVSRCMEKVRNQLSATSPVGYFQLEDTIHKMALPANRQRLAIEHDGKVTIINPDDIIMACCSDGQVMVHTKAKVYPGNMSLQDLQARLGEQQFFRSHRAFLVNIERIREVIPWFNGTYNLVLEGLSGTEVPVSRQQAPKLKKIFSL